MSGPKMLDADLFKDDVNLSGPGFSGYIVCIDTPDGYVKLRERTGKKVVAAAMRWAADRGVELRLHRVTGDYTP